MNVRADWRMPPAVENRAAPGTFVLAPILNAPAVVRRLGGSCRAASSLIVAKPAGSSPLAVQARPLPVIQVID